MKNKFLKSISKLLDNKDFIIILVLLTASLTAYGGVALRVKYNIDSNYFNYINDEAIYSRMSQGNNTDNGLYGTRILTPKLASFLPINPAYSFFLVNWFFTYLTSIVFYIYLKKLNFGRNISFIGALLFLANYVVSGFSGTIVAEPLSYFFWMLGFYFILIDNFPLLALSLFISLFNRETTMLLIPLYFFNRWKWDRTFFLGIMGLVQMNILKRVYTPTTQMVNMFTPITWVYKQHLVRWYNFALFLPAMFGIMWLLAILNYRKASLFVKKTAWLLPFIFLQHTFASSVIRPQFYAFPIIITLALYSFVERKNG
ncbi:MAG: hypothetical protein KKF44_07575 [Nanoarchaeota archaeon]|nr:hypothetical protein [Nanoarchaeota archaeon]